eukprot:102296-Rhodomonas_salina.2
MRWSSPSHAIRLDAWYCTPSLSTIAPHVVLPALYQYRRSQYCCDHSTAAVSQALYWIALLQYHFRAV